MYEKENDDNKVKVHILNKEYTIKTKGQSAEYVTKLIKLVNEQMQQVQAQNPVLSREDVDMLYALNLTDELFKVRQDYDELTHLIEENKTS